MDISGKSRWYLGVLLQGLIFLTGFLWLLTVSLAYFDNVSPPGNLVLGLIILSGITVIGSSSFLSLGRPAIRLGLFVAGCIIIYLAYLSVSLVPRVSA